MMKRTVFDVYHPAVTCCLFAAIIVFTMLVLHPVYIAISFVAACLYGARLRGWRSVLKGLSWQFPLIVITAFINPFFSASGSTELFRLASRVVYQESLLYGACFGGMLAAMLVWFSNAAKILTSDKIQVLFGKQMPTVSLMISTALSMVPRFLQQGKEVQAVHQVVQGKEVKNKHEKLKSSIRLTSVLVGWSMEDSLETADAMRARGWGSAAKHTTYQLYRVLRRDKITLLCLALLVASNGIAVYAVCSQFHFYPTVSSLTTGWPVVLYFVLMLAPLVAQGWEDARWKR